MKILQINTYDITGGASRAAYRLHRGLLQIGQDCRMLVRYKDSNDDSVFCIIPENPAEKVEEEFFLSVAIQEHYIDSHRTDISNTLFSLPYPGYDLSALPMVQAADIINLHWVANYQSPLTLHKLFALGKPVVWTLHDQWAFTGGCHYAAGCEEYRHGCVSCPQLADDPFGVPEAVLKDKLKFFKDDNLTIVTPSRWMAECAKESKLFKDLRIEVIPNSLETDVFVPQPKSEARESIGISAETVTLLFGGEDSNERRKGFRELKAAIKYCLKDARFENLVKSDKIRMICFGRPYDDLNTVGMPVVPLDYLDSDEKISAAYCAADIFVLPSLEDNLPNTMLEAMSCGTPVVAFDVGGMPDVIVNGVTGQLVPLCDTRQMGEVILSLIFDPDQREAMGQTCRKAMVNQYSLKVQAQRYCDLFEELGNSCAIEPSLNTSRDQVNSIMTPVQHTGVCLESDMGPHFRIIFDRILLKALKELTPLLQKELEASDADREARLEIINEQQEQIHSLNKHIESVSADSEARLKVIHEQQEQIQSLNKQIHSLNKHMESVSADSEARLKVIHEQQEQIQSLNKQIHSLNKHIESVSADSEARLKVIQQQQEQIQSLNKQIHSLNKHMESVSADLEARLKVIQQQQEQIQSLNKQIHSLNKHIESVSADLEARLKVIQQQQEQIQSLNKQIHSLNKHMESVSADSEARLKVIQQQQEQIQSYED